MSLLKRDRSMQLFVFKDSAYCIRYKWRRTQCSPALIGMCSMGMAPFSPRTQISLRLETAFVAGKLNKLSRNNWIFTETVDLPGSYWSMLLLGEQEGFLRSFDLTRVEEKVQPQSVRRECFSLSFSLSSTVLNVVLILVFFFLADYQSDWHFSETQRLSTSNYLVSLDVNGRLSSQPCSTA